MKEYKTVELAAADEFTEKKSRFIGYVKPVTTQQEAAAFINEIKAKHWDARHNVSAYVLRENHIQRSSDDGEPSGTAGVPVLDVLLKEGVVDACVVVTRYFGGVLLGAGGLIRAYSHASKLALEAGHIITMAQCKLVCVKVDYSFYERLTRLLTDYHANIENTEFAELIQVTFSIRENLLEALTDELTDISQGQYRTEIVGEKFAKISE